MKTKLSIALIICALGIGIFYSYYTFNKTIPTKEIKDTPFSVLLKNDKETFIENTEWYEVKLEYPKNNQKVREEIFSKYNDFVKETGIKNYTNLQSAKEGLQINVDGLRYSFIAEYKLATSTDSLSYVYEIYTFTGGAHGSTSVYPITLDINQNIIPVEKILPKNSLQKISQLAKIDLLKQKRERLKSFEMTDADIDTMLKNDDFLEEGVKPIGDNYSTLWYEGDYIVISFGQYQVGPYAEGLYEVRIPKSAIQ